MLKSFIYTKLSIGLLGEIPTGAIFYLMPNEIRKVWVWKAWTRNAIPAEGHGMQILQTSTLTLSCSLSVCKRRGLNWVISKAPSSFDILEKSLC